MGYFKARPIGEKTWYISEPLGVGAFLFEGERAALLMDTCNGFRDIRPVVKKLTDKPLTVVNSHGHADHAGGNRQFGEVYIHSADMFMLDEAWQAGQRELLFGYAKSHYPILRPLLFWLGRPKYQRVETKARALADGHVFDLGGRALKTIHVPGHSPGSVALADAATRTLYVGDAVNAGLFLFFEGSPTIAEYAGRLHGLAALSGFDEIRVSHSAKPLPFSFISYYADFLGRVTLAGSKPTDIPGGAGTVYAYTENGAQFGLKEVSVLFGKQQLEG